jgi:hypothetical protein
MCDRTKKMDYSCWYRYLLKTTPMFPPCNNNYFVSNYSLRQPELSVVPSVLMERHNTLALLRQTSTFQASYTMLGSPETCIYLAGFHTEGGGTEDKSPSPVAWTRGDITLQSAGQCFWKGWKCSENASTCIKSKCSWGGLPEDPLLEIHQHLILLFISGGNIV